MKEKTLIAPVMDHDTGNGGRVTMRSFSCAIVMVVAVALPEPTKLHAQIMTEPHGKTTAVGSA